MNPSQQLCDVDRTEAFLRGQLEQGDAVEFEKHLETCSDCRERIELLAAEQSSWSEARGLLGDRRWREDPQAGFFFSAVGIAERVNNERADTPTDEATEIESRQIRDLLSSLAPTDDPGMVGRIDGYEISGVIGCGGMAAVLKGHDRSLDRVVAIKVMAPHLASSGAARQRFRREAKAAAAITHDNVIDIYGVAEADGLPYLVMPYARGTSLQRRIDQHGPIRASEVLRIGMQIASGLAAAHAQGLVHRDIKPANILLCDGVERLVITDFGLARAVDDASVTKTGVIAGTPQYMSPEQARGESVDQRSDLFSLGSLMYAMCTGRPPFRADTSYGILRRITDAEPRPIREVNPDVPHWLCGIIAKLMSKRPGERFQSAEEVAELLEGCVAHVQQPAAVTLPPSVEQLSVAELAKTSGAANKPEVLRKSARNWNTLRLIFGAFLAFATLLAGVLIVLELNKGELKIESEANVAVRIVRGDRAVKKLTVTQSGASFRVAAGQYVVEIDGPADGLRIENDTVELRRGEAVVVRIVQTSQLGERKQVQTVVDAITAFNAQAELDSPNHSQPLLTEDELFAALHWTASDDLPSVTKEGLQLLAGAKVIPPRWKLTGGAYTHRHNDENVQGWTIILIDVPGGEWLNIRRRWLKPPERFAKPSARPLEDDTTPLASAVEAFNRLFVQPERHPLLTPEEVIAAIVAADSRRNELHNIARTHALPGNAKLNLTTETMGSDGLVYSLWHVRLVFEGQEQEKGLTIRKQFVSVQPTDRSVKQSRLERD